MAKQAKKFRLTKKKAKEICIELWTWLAETGNNYKGDWPGWNKYGRMQGDCPFCEYDTRHLGACDSCPIYQTYEKQQCFGLGFDDWKRTYNCYVRFRKAAAAKFLEMVKGCKC